MWIWGLGIGDWGLGIGPNPQSPIPKPQSPIPNFIYFFNLVIFILYIRFPYKILNIKKNKKYWVLRLGQIHIFEIKNYYLY